MHFSLKMQQDHAHFYLGSQENVANACKIKLFFSQTDQQQYINTQRNEGEVVVNVYCTFFTCKEHTPDKRLSSHPGLVGCSYIRNVCS